MKRKFLCPYRGTTVKANDRYKVDRIDQGEGPRKTATAVDFMKPQALSTGGDNDDDFFQDDFVEDEVVSRDGRGV